MAIMYMTTHQLILINNKYLGKLRMYKLINYDIDQLKAK